MWLHSQHTAPSEFLLLCQASVGRGQDQKAFLVILPPSTDSQPDFCPRSYIFEMEKSKESLPYCWLENGIPFPHMENQERRFCWEKTLQLSNQVDLLHAMAEAQQHAVSPHGAFISSLSTDPEAPTTDVVTGNPALQQISRLQVAKERDTVAGMQPWLDYSHKAHHGGTDTHTLCFHPLFSRVLVADQLSTKGSNHRAGGLASPRTWQDTAGMVS